MNDDVVCGTCRGAGVVDENGNPSVWGRADSHECPDCEGRLLMPMELAIGTYESLNMVPAGSCLCCGMSGQLAVWESQPLPLVTHGVCATCRDKARA